MKIAQIYINKIASAESVFDMAVICYKILEDKISNPVAFISQYIDEGDEEVCLEFKNPNFKRLQDFSVKVAERLEKYSELDFPQQRSDIVHWMHTISLEAFLEEEKNQLSIVFILLTIIDSLVPVWIQRGIITMGKSLLNRGKSRRYCYAYLTYRQCIHETLMQNIGRERKANGDFGETLDNLLFIKKDELPKKAMPPEVSFLTRRNNVSSFCVTVAIITGLSGYHFKITRTHGSTRIIEYIPEIQIELAGKVWGKMQKAIENGAEFIILPEFCVSEGMLGFIKQKLLEYKAYEKSNLIAVFPGSTWTETNDNVQFILDAWGRERGQYYKNMPYRKRKKNVGGYQFCEGLANPGYRTSLLCIEGLGYILPATCRDVIDGIYTNYFASRFHPTFLFVPAWSASGRAFVQPLKRYAMDYYTSSVLCNACGALKRKTGIVGGAVVPVKDKTVASGYFREIKMSETSAKNCNRRCDKLCGHILEIDYSDKDAVGCRISYHKY